MKKITKAERIYKQTRYDCMQHISTCGYNENPDHTAIGFSGLSYDNNECVSTRTVNAVNEILKKERENLKIDQELGLLNKKEAEKEIQILNMIESTIKNQYKNLTIE